MSGKTKDLFEISSDSSDGEEMNIIVEKLISNKSLSMSSTSLSKQQQQQHFTTETDKPVKSNKKRTHNSKKPFPPPTNMSTPVGKHLQQQQQQQNETPANRSFSSTPVQRSIRRYGKIKKSVNPFSPARKQVSIVFVFIDLFQNVSLILTLLIFTEGPAFFAKHLQ